MLAVSRQSCAGASTRQAPTFRCTTPLAAATIRSPSLRQQRRVQAGFLPNTSTTTTAPGATTAGKPLRNLESDTLTKDELHSLGLAAGRLSIQLPTPEAAEGAGMVSEAAWAEIASVLKRGAAKGEPDLPFLEGCTLLAEQVKTGALSLADGSDKSDSSSSSSSSSSNNNSSGSGAPASLDGAPHVGTWQPIFASAGGFPRLLYIPVAEYFDLRQAGEGQLNIITEMGPVTTHFLGEARWVAPDRLQYGIRTLRVDVGGRRLFSLPFKLDNELAFFYMDVDDEQQGAPYGAPGATSGAQVAAARSKLGGTMLMAPRPAGSYKYGLPASMA